MATSAADIWKGRIDKWLGAYREVEHTHDTARRWYNNHFPTGLMTVNLIFSFGRAMVPQLYFKNPSVNVQIKGELAQASRYLQEVDVELIRQMKIKRTIKKMIVNGYLTGRGVAKLGFANDGEAPEVFDPAALIKPHAPWFLSLLTKNWATEIPPDGDIDDLGWAGMKVSRTRAQLEAIDGAILPEAIDTLPEDDPDATLDLWEIWDRGSGERGLLHEDKWVIDPEPFTVWPFHVLEFNWVPEETLPVSDAELVLKLQAEYNETETQIAEHRRLSIVRALAKKGAINQEERDKLERGQVGALVEVDTAGPLADSITTFAPSIPEALFASKTMVMQDARDVIGFSRNQLGEMQTGSRRTFGEAAIVQQALQIRLDERRDMVADMIEQVMHATNQLVFEKWNADDARRYGGLTDPQVWAALSRIEKDDYTITIVPDSTLPLTKAVQRQNALQLFAALKADPLIDQVELRKILLEGFEGIDPMKLIDMQAAEMMKQVPPMTQPAVMQMASGQSGAMGAPGNRPQPGAGPRPAPARNGGR